MEYLINMSLPGSDKEPPQAINEHPRGIEPVPSFRLPPSRRTTSRARWRRFIARFSGHFGLALVGLGFVLVQLASAGVQIGGTLAASTFFGALVIILIGEGIQTVLIDLPSRTSIIMAGLIGYVAVTAVLLVGVLGLHASASSRWLWAVLGTIAILSALAAYRKERTSAQAFDIAAAIVIACAVAAWSQGITHSVAVLRQSGSFPAWIDYFIHGAQIAEFGDRLAVGRGSIMLSDFPRIFYHYGMYFIPAALVGLAGTSGLVIATSILAPLGLFLALLAAYALATELGGRWAGLLAIAGFVILPDASLYGLGNGFFSFHWLMYTSPGSGYGIMAFVCMIMVLHAARERPHLTIFLAAAALLIAVFAYRTHFFLWTVPTLVLAYAAAHPEVRGRIRPTILFTVGAVALTVVTALLLSLAPIRDFWLKHAASWSYLIFAHASCEPTNYADVFPWIVARVGQGAAAVVGAVLVLPASLGLLLLALPVSWHLASRKMGPRPCDPIDLVPGAMVLVCLAASLFAPADPWGNTTEYQHRPLVLLYAVFVVWTAIYLGRLAMAQVSRRAQSVGLTAVLVIAAALAALTQHDPARPLFFWGRNSYGVAIRPGLVAAADWVKHQARIGETAAVAPVEPTAALVDTATQVASLTDLPEYLGRPGSQIVQDARRRDVALARLDLMNKIEAAPSLQEAAYLLAEAGINYYFWFGDVGPPFDPQRQTATFRDGATAVYRLTPSH